MYLLTGFWGRECKLGWGYNQPFGQLISVQGQPPNVTSVNVNWWEYDAYSLSSTTIICSVFISLFLELSDKKFLDFQIVFDDNQYWLIESLFWRRAETSGKLPEYPPNCSHFVNRIGYGVDLWVLFPKVGSPEDKYEVNDLFRSKNFNETQKKAKCRVLINYNEIREITLQELLSFIDEVKEGKHSQYDIPVGFDYRKLTQEVRGTVISNQNKFSDFLSYLYCVYRKIEIKMKEAGYPDVLPDLDSNEVSLKNIRKNLNKAKEEYKSIDKNDFLKMYPVLKKLFFSYTDYIRYCMDNSVDMDEGDRLPGDFDEMKPWSQQLNTWIPEKINGEWISSMKCRVWMNYNEVKEFTFGQLLELKRAVEDGKRPDLNTLISFYHQKLSAQIRGMKISNDEQFTDFISHLYFLYRKIEVKMKEAGYEYTLPDFKFEEKSFVDVCAELKETKNVFNSMDRSDFLKMYPVLKELFFCYMNYINSSIKLKNNIDEGNHLPETTDELKLWFDQLNKWFPIKVNKEWINCMDFFVGLPRGFDQVHQTLRGTYAFNSSQIINDDEAIEPYIRKENNQKILFGFVNMERGRRYQDTENLILLEKECPQACTDDMRSWICTTCGDDIKIKVNPDGFQYLFCSCGSKEYSNNLLTCTHTMRQQFTNNDLLRSIRQQLKEIRDRNDGIVDERIHIAINYIANNRNEEDMRDALEGLQNLPLNTNIRHMIDLYLNGSH